MQFNFPGRIRVIIAVLIIVFVAFLILVFQLSRSDYFSRSERIDADILVVEGWLPDTALDLAYDEYGRNNYKYVVTTGLSTQEYCLVSMDGYLIFDLKNKLKEAGEDSPNTIEVTAYSELDGKDRACFSIWVNDSILQGFCAGRKEKKYGVTWQAGLEEIDSLMIQFTNDAMGDFGDRNLFVKELTVNKKLVIPFQKNSKYDIGAIDGQHRFIYDYNSLAETARKELIRAGADSLKVIAVPGGKTTVNQTLASVLAFRKWFKDTGVTAQGINIVSLGAHSRRTAMIYKKVLGRDIKIGIISLPDKFTTGSGKRNFLKTLREAAGIVYYWIILIPYQLS